MFRRLVALLLLGVAAASSDEACRTDCFDLSDECEATCLELGSEGIQSCFAECEPSLATCIQMCGPKPDKEKPSVPLVSDEQVEASRRLARNVNVGLGNLTLVLRHDDWPDETAWTFRKETRPRRLLGAQTTGSFQTRNGTVVKGFSIVTAGQYKFKLLDDDGDGILPPGSLEFLLNGTRVYYESPLRFSYSRSVVFNFY
jgi:hypothetical protein